jgi:hypothetical protein
VPQGTNAFQQSAGNLNMAQQGTIASGMGPNMQQFANPYQNQVIDRTQQDIERQRQMATNTLGAQASAAGAFGGSRHGVAEGITNEGFARQAANTFANQRQQGFDTALGAAQRQQGIGLQASGQLGNLSQTGFDQAMRINQNQQQQGLSMQALNQQLIDAARAQYAGFSGAPERSLALPMQAVQAGNMGQSTQTGTQESNPGLLGYLSLGASLLSDRRLKTNVRPVGTRGGLTVYEWDWNEDGRHFADLAQPTVGFMADEVAQKYPEFVTVGADGYQRVNYAGLAAELG